MTKQPQIPVLTRRRALQLLGVGAAGATLAAAGCSRSDEASDGGGGDGEFHAAYPYFEPPKGHFNVIGGITDEIVLGYLRDLFLVPGGIYMWDAQEWVHLLADDSSGISEDGKTFTYVVRDGLTWSDDKPITAQDVYTTFLVRWTNNAPAFAFVSSFEMTDEKTVTFHIGTPAPIAEYYIMRHPILSDAAYGKWGKQAEQLIKAGKAYDDDEAVKVLAEVTKFKPDSVIVSGPFDFDYDSIANQQLTLVKNDKGYLADKINFDKIVVYNGETDTVQPLVLDGAVDYATHGFPIALDQQLQKQDDRRILRPPVYSGPALCFNYSKYPELHDKRVRQALAYVIDRKSNGRAMLGESGLDIKLMAGMSDSWVPTWMNEDDQAKLNPYEQDLDMAAQLLEDAGWTKDGDTWKTSEGKTASYDLLYPGDFADWPGSAENAVDQLNAFGFKMSRRAQDSTVYNDQIDNGQFDWCLLGWGSSGNPYPSHAYRPILLDRNVPALKAENKKGINFDTKQETDIVGSIDFEQAIVDAGLGDDEDALKANVGKLALAFNELLPGVPLCERAGNNPVNLGNVVGWPDDDDPIYKNSPYADNFVTILMYDGRLKPA